MDLDNDELKETRNLYQEELIVGGGYRRGKNLTIAINMWSYIQSLPDDELHGIFKKGSAVGVTQDKVIPVSRIQYILDTAIHNTLDSKNGVRLRRELIKIRKELLED